MKESKFKFSTIISGLIWILVIGVIAIIFTDYTLVKNEKEPKFCLKKETINNNNGRTDICTGLGYKYYNTVGNGYISKKFVPIWHDEEEDLNE